MERPHIGAEWRGHQMIPAASHQVTPSYSRNPSRGCRPYGAETGHPTVLWLNSRPNSHENNKSGWCLGLLNRSPCDILVLRCLQELCTRTPPRGKPNSLWAVSWPQAKAPTQVLMSGRASRGLPEATASCGGSDCAEMDLSWGHFELLGNSTSWKYHPPEWLIHELGTTVGLTLQRGWKSTHMYGASPLCWTLG